MFTKILIANRGKIACQVIRTRSRTRLPDRRRLQRSRRHAHVSLADEAVLIGPAPVRRSYLRADTIIDACRKTGADAVRGLRFPI